MRNGFVDESLQASLIDVRSTRATTLPLRLTAPTMGVLADERCLPPFAALVGVPVLVLAADESFINLDDAAELVHVVLDKRRADAMAHIPSGFVGAEAHRRA